MSSMMSGGGPGAGPRGPGLEIEDVEWDLEKGIVS